MPAYAPGFGHCLYLNFTHKDGSSYLLNNDKSRLAFNLDLGLAGELYSLAIGLVDEFTYRVVRSRKTPKSIHGVALAKDRRRIVCLMAEGSKRALQSGLRLILIRPTSSPLRLIA